MAEVEAARLPKGGNTQPCLCRSERTLNTKIRCGADGGARREEARKLTGSGSTRTASGACRQEGDRLPSTTGVVCGFPGKPPRAHNIRPGINERRRIFPDSNS